MSMLTLDVGCGERKHGGLGIDVRLTPHVDLLASTYFLPFKAEIFDKVYMFEVLEHLENPSGALREVGRVLRRAGTVEGSIPNPYWCGRLLRVIMHRDLEEQYTSCEHINAWTISELRHLVHRCRLELRSCRYGDSGFYKGLGSLVQLLRLNRLLKAITNHQLLFQVRKP
ncbi:methyltransferase domain-containing protein [Candidatus Bathyarchaeota archaeon]|nr:methyltransferase domain-containing protein [Candidatus Bathyarchaeota archaeon]